MPEPRLRPSHPTRIPGSTMARVMRALARAIDGLDYPVVEKIAEDRRHNAFHVLVSTMLSARTQDKTTEAASERLFAVADTPDAIARLSLSRIERLIYPVSFYRDKARHLKAACRLLIDAFGGRVPATMEQLLTLPGVGRKTANLVLILAHQSRANICVDTHVHRISNRLGWVKTKTPEQTEQALYQVVPQRWWPLLNLYFVTWGQNVCRPIAPRCAGCVISPVCARVGVEAARARRRTPSRAT